MPRVPFAADDVDAAAYAELREACLKHGFLPAFRHGILLDVAMVDPEDEAALAAIRRLTHQEVRRFGIGAVDFDRAVADLEALSRRGATEHRVEEGEPMDRDTPRCPESWDCDRSSAREVAARLVRFAHASGASDLILDEQEGWMDVAIKVDGRKEILAPVERAGSASLLRAFREIAGMSTQTVNAWQSGAASFPIGGGRWADLRIEITPTVHGESLVARLHDRELQLERMRRLPFTDPGQRRLAEDCLARSQGLIVATGPTGHGKTSTLYACLGRLDRSALNIRTLEDPVEFVVPWITQIPVGSDTGRGFGEGLKSLLRQAPHVVLLGEIRDEAVARTSMDAVNTGHLILATLHTRDAIGAVPRLLDLGVAARQIAASLLLVIGQRLVRRLCPHCRRPAKPTPPQAAHFERHRLPVPDMLYLPGGCARCGGRGERGLLPIFELFHPADNDALADRMMQDPFSERALRSCWLEAGGSPLARDGLRLAAAGEIACAEALAHERR